MISPPSSISRELYLYLTEYARNVESELFQLRNLKVEAKIPTKPIIGKIYYFSRAIAPDITEEGWWGYKSTGWVQLG